MDLPRKLGRYELLHELARGGMGVVYLGRVRSMGGFSRLVAIKTCLPQHLRDQAFVSMFLDEARIAARVRHPNVVATVDVDRAEELFLAMEYIEGERLLDLSRAGHALGGIPLGIALRVLIDALNGLHAAHIQEDSDGSPLNIVHRDISPHNILIGNDGLSRIADFGVARAERRLAQTMVGGAPKGKLAYMSPEQLLELPIDARSDVFSAGVVAWEFLVGARLFDGESETRIVAQIVDVPIESLSERRADIPPSLSHVVLTALQRPLEQRYQSAADFAEALESCGVAVATHRAVADYLRDALGDRIEKRTALRRRIEAIPPLEDEIAAPAPAPKSAAPLRTMFSSPGPGAPPFNPSATQQPQLFYPAPTAHAMGSTPGYPVQLPVQPHTSQPTSLAVWAGVAMVSVGLIVGALGIVRRTQLNEESRESPSIEMPAAVAMSQQRQPLPPPESPTQEIANTNALVAPAGSARAIAGTTAAAVVAASAASPSDGQQPPVRMAQVPTPVTAIVATTAAPHTTQHSRRAATTNATIASAPADEESPWGRGPSSNTSSTQRRPSGRPPKPPRRFVGPSGLTGSDLPQ